eukprot:2403647-Prymnesium_polylepis.1
MLVCSATSRGEYVKSQPQKVCFWAARGALERWFGGPTRSPTCPRVFLVHGRPCHNLKQHNYEPSARWGAWGGRNPPLQGLTSLRRIVEYGRVGA